MIARACHGSPASSRLVDQSAERVRVDEWRVTGRNDDHVIAHASKFTHAGSQAEQRSGAIHVVGDVFEGPLCGPVEWSSDE